MQLKETLKTIIKIILLISIVFSGIFLVYSEVQAKKVSSWETAEIFKDDIPYLNNKEHPSHLFADVTDPNGNSIYLFCGEHGRDVDGYMTAPQIFYNVYYSQNPKGNAYYDENNPYYIYRHSGVDNYGLISSFETEYDDWKDGLEGYCHTSISAYSDDWDDQEVIDSLRRHLPGLGIGKLRSIEYRHEDIDGDGKSTYLASEVPHVAFIVTQNKTYATANDTPKDASHETALTDKEKEEGYFNIDEKQTAIWNTDMNIGNAPNNKDTDDRNLGIIAKGFKTFYDTIHKNANGYKDVVEALPATNQNAGDIDKGKTEKLGDIEAGIDKYKYKSAKVSVDQKEQCYVIGPFKIDYSVNDGCGDIYTSFTDANGKQNEVKFNAIQQITVYNHEGRNIESLGGKFKIAYEWTDNTKAEDKDVKLHRISDENNAVVADHDGIELDYKEVSAFESGKEFYIVVYRGNMSAEQFKGFYAKVEFQYLKDINGTFYEYVGHVMRYYYEESTGTITIKKSGTVYTDDTEETDEDHEHDEKSIEEEFDVTTYTYTLKRDEWTGTTAQRMIGYACNGERIYDTYSIVLTTNWEDVESPKFELIKECENGERLYGARFDVILRFDGRDGYGNKIDKTITLSRKTNSNGKITVTSGEIEAAGVYIGTFTGTLDVRFKETKAPAGHKGSANVSTTVSLTNGKLSSGSDTVTLTAKNKHVNTPVIKLTKVNSNIGKIENASFKVHVTYTNSKGITINNPKNIIEGSTDKNGDFNITRDDLLDMPEGFDIRGYTGKVTLQIAEVGVAGNYTVTSKSLSIDFKFKNGKLIEYGNNTTAEVLVNYLYGDPLSQIYDYITKGTKLPKYVHDKLQEWLEDNKKRLDAEGFDWSYKDLLDWLADYIEKNHDSDGESSLEEWRVATLENTGRVIQVVIRDDTRKL